MQALIYGLLLLLVVESVILLFLFVRVNEQKKDKIVAESNAVAISMDEVRIEKSEIINRFYDYQMDAFLRYTFPSLCSWNPVHEERVGFRWNGLHVVTCRMLDGNRFNVSVFVRNDHITPELYEEPKEKDVTVSYEELAAEWLEKWNSELAAHAIQERGFSIPREQIPKEEKVLELVIEHIAMQGDFSTQLDDDCLRLAYSIVE